MHVLCPETPGVSERERREPDQTSNPTMPIPAVGGNKEPSSTHMVASWGPCLLNIFVRAPGCGRSRPASGEVWSQAFLRMSQ